MHSFFHDNEIRTLIWIFSTAKPNYPGCQQSKIFASLDYYLLHSCYHDFHIRGRFLLQFHKKKSLTLYLLLFLVLDVKLQILQRNKTHYSGMLQSLTNWPLTTVSLALFLWSQCLPHSPQHFFHSYPSTSLKTFISVSPVPSIWTHKRLPSLQSRNYREIYSGAWNYFLSFTSAITDWENTNFPQAKS